MVGGPGRVIGLARLAGGGWPLIVRSPEMSRRARKRRTRKGNAANHGKRPNA
jgi:hypothetical protein